jgi:hypothetical protein
MSQKLEYELKGKSDVEQVTGRAKKSVETLGQSFKKAGDDIVKKFAGMFAGAVLFDKALNFISGTFRELGAVADQVDRSGLSPEQFQKLAYAAQQSGVSISALAKATRQLRVDMAEAAAGTGKKVEMFKALGISIDQLKSGDATAVFLAIAKAMSGSADDSERLLISTAFFGDKIGNDILPLLGDYLKLSKDIANAPIVDGKTLKLIGDYNDGMDTITSKMKVFVAYIFSAYDAYSKFISKIAETAATFGFDVSDKVAIKPLEGVMAKSVSGLLSNSPHTGALVAMGADGSIKASGSASPAKGGEAAKALLAAIGGTAKAEKEKSADAKAKDPSASSVSGSVIGVGANPVVMAMQEQTEIAKQQLDYLRIMASKTNGSQIDPNLTNKGATPATPASNTRI